MVDLNRDGNLDLYVANGHVLERPDRQGVSYQSSGDRRIVFRFPEDETPNTIEIIWPSGARTSVPLVTDDYDRYVTVTEEDGS